MNYCETVESRNFFNGDISILSAIDIYKYESRFERNMTVELGERDTLKIKNSLGNVEVVKGDSDKIEIKANITIRNNDEKSFFIQKVFPCTL
jgi:hypothetical protein